MYQRKVFRLLAVYCIKGSQTLLEKRNIQFYMGKSCIQTAKYYIYEDRSFYLGFCISFNFFCQGKFCLAAHVDKSLTLMNFIPLWSINANTKNFPSFIWHESFILMLKCYIFEHGNFCTKSKFLEGKVLSSGTCWWGNYAIWGKWTFVLQRIAAKTSLVLFGIKLVFRSVRKYMLLNWWK